MVWWKVMVIQVTIQLTLQLVAASWIVHDNLVPWVKWQ